MAIELYCWSPLISIRRNNFFFKNWININISHGYFYRSFEAPLGENKTKQLSKCISICKSSLFLVTVKGTTVTVSFALWKCSPWDSSEFMGQRAANQGNEWMQNCHHIQQVLTGTHNIEIRIVQLLAVCPNSWANSHRVQ